MEKLEVLQSKKNYVLGYNANKVLDVTYLTTSVTSEN